MVDHHGVTCSLDEDVPRLADDADNPTYIFTEPRVGYCMAMGDTAGDE